MRDEQEAAQAERPSYSSLIPHPSSLSLLLLMLCAVIAEDDRFAVHDGFEMDGAPPECIDIFEHLARVSLIQFRAFVLVLEIEFAVAVVVAVGDDDVRETEVG